VPYQDEKGESNGESWEADYGEWLIHVVFNGKILPVFPSAHTQQKADDISLLLLPNLFQVLVGSHVVLSNGI
jgi:hypothetical protein